MKKKVFVVSYVYREGSGRPVNRIVGVVESSEKANDLLNLTHATIQHNVGNNLTSIEDDSQKIYVISLRMKLLYDCLILNFEAIRKICKKFDNKRGCGTFFKHLHPFINS